MTGVESSSGVLRLPGRGARCLDAATWTAAHSPCAPRLPPFFVLRQDLFNKLGSTTTAMASAISAPSSADLRASYTMGSTIAGIEEVRPHGGAGLIVVAFSTPIGRGILGRRLAPG